MTNKWKPLYYDFVSIPSSVLFGMLSLSEWVFLMFSQHKSYLLEAWRMFHSVAFQLEYLFTVNRTLQSLVNEEVSRAFRPVLDDDERTVGDTSWQPTCIDAFLFFWGTQKCYWAATLLRSPTKWTPDRRFHYRKTGGRVESAIWVANEPSRGKVRAQRFQQWRWFLEEEKTYLSPLKFERKKCITLNCGPWFSKRCK